jgi:hypothetical protein
MASMGHGQQATTTRQLLTPYIVAAMLDVHPDTLARWRHRGDGPPYLKLGSGRTSAVRYLQEDVDAYLVAHRRAAAASHGECV